MGDEIIILFGGMVALCCCCIAVLIIWDYSRDDSFLFGEDGLLGSNDDSTTSASPGSNSDSSNSDSSNSRSRDRSRSGSQTYNPYIDGESFITNTTMTRDDCSTTTNDGLGIYCTDKVLLAPHNCGNGVSTCSESSVERGQGKDCNVVFPGNLLDNEATVCGNDDATSPCPNWAITQLGEIMKSEPGWNGTSEEKKEIINNFLFVGDEGGNKCTNKMVVCDRWRNDYGCRIQNTSEEEARIIEETQQALVDINDELESSEVSDAADEYRVYIESDPTVSPPHMLPINSCPSGQVRYTAGAAEDAPLPCIPPRCYIKDGLYYAADPDEECRPCRIATVADMGGLVIRSDDGTTEVHRTDEGVCAIDNGSCCDADNATKWFDPSDNQEKYVCGMDVCGDQWNPDSGRTSANRAPVGCKPVDFDTDVRCDLNESLEESLETIDLYNQGIQPGSCEDPNALEIHCDWGYIFKSRTDASAYGVSCASSSGVPGNLSGPDQTHLLKHFNDNRELGRLAKHLYENNRTDSSVRGVGDSSLGTKRTGDAVGSAWASIQSILRDGVPVDDARRVLHHMRSRNWSSGRIDETPVAELDIKSRSGETCPTKEVKCLGTVASGEYAGQDCSAAVALEAALSKPNSVAPKSMDTWRGFNWCLTVDGNDPAVGCYVGVGDKVN